MTLITTPRMVRRTIPLSAAIATLLFGSQLAMAQDGMKAKARSLANTCRSDYDRLCKGVMPGGGRVVACLAEKADSLTPDCKAALPEANHWQPRPRRQAPRQSSRDAFAGSVP